MPVGGNMRTKNASMRVKAGPDDGLEEGQFVAYASVFDNVDSYGDVVRKGAFVDDLARWKKSGNSVPVLFGHNMSDPDYNIGYALELSEDGHGLLVKGQLDLEHAKSLQVYRLLKGRRVSELSFAYDVLDSGPTEVDGVEATELRKLRLYEISIVPIGANSETEVLAVKSAAGGSSEASGGISADVLALLTDARDALSKALTAMPDEEEASGGEGVKGGAGDEGHSVKSAAAVEGALSHPSVANRIAELSIFGR